MTLPRGALRLLLLHVGRRAGRAAVDNDRLALYISDLMLPLVEAVTGRKMQTGFVKTG